MRRTTLRSALAAVLWLIAAAAHAQTFIVNSPSDVVGADPGNHVCETALHNGVCTLRRAIIEANHWPGGGATVDMRSLPGGAATLTIPASGSDDETTGDLDITASMTLLGAGPSTSIIYGNGDVIHDRVVHVHGGAVSLIGVTIRDGREPHDAFPGNGISITGGSTTLINSVVAFNSSLLFGATVYAGDAAVTLIGSAIHDNISSDAALHALADATVVNSTIQNNAGGGIWCDQECALTLTNSTVSGNSGYGTGGVAVSYSSARISRSTVSGNNNGGRGGGIYNLYGSVVLVDSTVSGNNATFDGGGIYNFSYDAQLPAGVAVYNSTITLNQADSDFNGSGIGGGIMNDGIGASFVFQNTILARNFETFLFHGIYLFVGGECAGTLVSNGYNLLENYDASHCTVLGGGITLNSPGLGPLQDNGGPTPTHAPDAGSPAIDAGNPFGCRDDVSALIVADQRSYPRPAPQVDRCDIGAVEAGASSGFTDEPLVRGSTIVKQAHVTELRTRIDAQRARFGLAPFAWTNASLVGAVVHAIDVTDLRTALTDAYTAAGQLAPTFGKAIVAQSTLIAVDEFEELRNAVLYLETT
jgi:hypothetical protein